jgi:hypothetical protein
MCQRSWTWRLADGPASQRKDSLKSVMNSLFERIEQRNGQIERFVLHP